MVNRTYRPLPDFLTIKKSDIDGLGLFATENIRIGKTLGVSHYVNNRDKHAGIIRTPLGGFINHSETPNLMKIIKSNEDFIEIKVKTLRKIVAGEELTLKYDWYEPQKKI